MTTSLMSKLKIITLITSLLFLVSCNGTSSSENISDKDRKDGVVKLIKNNPRFSSANVVVDKIVKLPADNNWAIYLIKVNDRPLILYSNGTYFATNMMKIADGSGLDNLIIPKFSDDDYSDAHLISGNKNAKNKVVVFSDPVCPFCIRTIPNIYADVKDNSDIALYYYHFPLASIHPSSIAISKAMIVAKNQGIKNILPRVYKDGLFSAKASEKEVLEIFNKTFNTKITSEDINKEEIKKELENDLQIASKLMINGTPSVYFNGEKDPTLFKYKQKSK